jgi:putative flippase GtrA
MKNTISKQATLFIVFSVSAGLVQLLVFSLLFELVKVGYWMAYVPSILSLIFWNTFWNRKYTFQSNIKFRVVILKLIVFYLFFIPVSTLLGEQAISVGWNEYVVLGLSMIINVILAFFYNKYLVYHT